MTSRVETTSRASQIGACVLIALVFAALVWL